jgi:hypothetical protein
MTAPKAAATAHEVHAAASTHAAHPSLRVGEVIEGGLPPLAALVWF